MKEFNAKSFEVFDREWALVTAGTKDSCNAMTISWGGLGTLWGKPVATVYVKPVRYTWNFMKENDYFTVSFYDEQYRKALGVFGSKSGRDTDKVKETGFTPVYLENAVTFREAKTTLLCRKIYTQDLDIDAIPDFARERYYTEEAPHTMFIGEVIDIL